VRGLRNFTSNIEVLRDRSLSLLAYAGQNEYSFRVVMSQQERSPRRAVGDKREACGEEVGVDPSVADELLSLYGVDVAYGNTLRDIDAVTRSFETQVRVDGGLNTATMTGRTGFDQVRETLERLDKPEARFDDRIHLVAASSMMSHGVDIDRLNLLVMLGFPLTTAEFIQTSARVGRTHPGVVFVIPRMARERDAGIYRAFTHFVHQGDRFVEATDTRCVRSVNDELRIPARPAVDVDHGLRIQHEPTDLNGCLRDDPLDIVEEAWRVREVERGAEPVHHESRQPGRLP